MGWETEMGCWFEFEAVIDWDWGACELDSVIGWGYET